MLLWVRLPADAIWTAQAAGTLHDLYARGARPAAARWAFVAEATAAARSCRDVTEPCVAGGATAGGFVVTVLVVTVLVVTVLVVAFVVALTGAVTA